MEIIKRTALGLAVMAAIAFGAWAIIQFVTAYWQYVVIAIAGTAATIIILSTAHNIGRDILKPSPTPADDGE